MALSDAINDIAKEMEEDAESFDDPNALTASHRANRVLKRYARQLRTLVKASENTVPIIPQSLGNTAFLIGKEDPHASLKARLANEAQLGVVRSKARQEDLSGDRMVEVVGGPEGTSQVSLYVPIAAGMPEGANTIIENAVYTLRDGKLVFSPALTQKEFGS